MDKLQIIKKPALAILEEKTKICQYKEENLNLALLDNLDYLFALLGVNQQEDKKMQYVILSKTIKEEYSHLTFEEILEAFKMFIKGQFDIKPFQQLNSLVFAQVMKHFEDYKRIKLFEYKRNLNKEQEPMISEKEKEEIVLNGLKKAFEHYRTHNKMKEVCFHYYDYLDALNLIKMSLEEKNKIFYYAKKTIEFELKDKKNITKEENDAIKRILKDGIPKNEVVVLAKKLALEDIFKELIKKNVNINDLINKK